MMLLRLLAVNTALRLLLWATGGRVQLFFGTEVCPKCRARLYYEWYCGECRVTGALSPTFCRRDHERYLRQVVEQTIRRHP